MSVTGAALKGIIAQVVEINGLMLEMAHAATQQSTGIQEVNAAVTQMDQVTQQNAAMVEESTAASRNLAAETKGLVELLSFFRMKHVDGGSKSAGAAQPRQRLGSDDWTHSTRKSARFVRVAGGCASTAAKIEQAELPKAGAERDEWVEF